MLIKGIGYNDLSRSTIPSRNPPLSTLTCLPTLSPREHLPPSVRGDDVRPSISRPDTGDDTGNLACEFSPASDMVLRLHASLRLQHAKERGVLLN